MLYSKLFIPTVKEVPKDAKIQSHILMIRSGFIKKVTSGIYSILPLGYRTIKKVENIIREEMDAIGGNEFFLPVLVPGELWKMSKRWYTWGSELYRLKDRNLQDYVLTPTHEEVFTSLLKDNIKSYRDLPITVYHIGLKFRDEIRPRFGVMRGKTFIMKDAYSFHRAGDTESLHKTYTDMGSAYTKIFKRCGLDTIPVVADSGTMGGSQSEEFMVPAEVGEEEILKCSYCGYIANITKAVCKNENIPYKDSGLLSTVETPNVKTITDLSEFLHISQKQLIKTLIYKTSEDKFIMALIRGDLEMHETKLKNYLGVSEVEKADTVEVMQKLGIPLGFAGPIGIKDLLVLADFSIKDIKGGVTGANRDNYHYINVSAERDFEPDDYIDIRSVREGDLCPNCGKDLTMFRGIELGHIFKLGDKYTKAFSVFYLDEDGSSKIPLMGCYGIGVERIVAAVIEQNYDKDGIIWPLTVSPFHVYILPIKYSSRVKEVSERLYNQLEGVGVEVLLDDRDMRPGIKFKDADLIGIPYRLTISDKNLKNGVIELTERKTGKAQLIVLEDIVGCLKKKIEDELEKYGP